MAKSNLQLLQEAIAKGDLERAAILTDKIAKAGKPKSTKTKVTNKPKALVSKLKQPKKTKAIADLDESEYLAPTRNGDDYWGGRIFTDQNGNTHQYGRRVSMEGTKFVNKFDPTNYDRLPANLDKFDKKQKRRRGKVARPGEPGAMRDPARKVRATCNWCRNQYSVYPWECEKVDSEMRYCCNKCVKMR